MGLRRGSRMSLSGIKILLCGSGGVGCELVKNLMQCGVDNLTIYDMDSVDVSNLNRQFLFTRADINRYKAEVAREKALEYNSSATVKFFIQNVCQLKPNDIQEYDVVLNALDNIAARSHINKICLLSNTPLIESGSTGFNGQVMPIVGQVTSCYDCNPKPLVKSYPICTIRQIPRKPEHCIAWARQLFQLLFGCVEENNLLLDLNLPPIPTDKTPESLTLYSQNLFKYLFHDQIIELIDLLKKSQFDVLPTPLSIDRNFKKQKKNDEKPAILNLHEGFISSVTDILKSTTKPKEYDKDDDLAAAFVTSAAKLRMNNFSISTISDLEIQTIAGSIIPAIAATNAIVAAAQVMQLFHLKSILFDKDKIKNNVTMEKLVDGGIRNVWIKSYIIGNKPRLRGNCMQPEAVEGPNVNCPICQSIFVSVKLKSFNAWTMGKLVGKICHEALYLREPLIDMESTNLFDYEVYQEEPEYRSNVESKPLDYWGITPNRVVELSDLASDVKMQLILQSDASLDEDFKVIKPANFQKSLKKMKGSSKRQKPEPAPTTFDIDSDDQVIISE